MSDLSGAKQLTGHQAKEPGRTEAPRPVLRLIPQLSLAAPAACEPGPALIRRRPPLCQAPVGTPG